MVHFKDTTHKNAGIFGDILRGTLTKANPLKKDNFTRIFNFKCEIKKETDSSKEIRIKNDFPNHNFVGEIGTSMSGRRGIVVPEKGYKGQVLRPKKKHKKSWKTRFRI